jgi:hypothetical protein
MQKQVDIECKMHIFVASRYVLCVVVCEFHVLQIRVYDLSYLKNLVQSFVLLRDLSSFQPRPALSTQDILKG